MATTKGQEFINKYKGTDCLKESWKIMYSKGHITLDEFAECANLTDEEKDEYSEKQIDICPDNKPTLDDLIAEATSNRERLDVLESAILDLIIE